MRLRADYSLTQLRTRPRFLEDSLDYVSGGQVSHAWEVSHTGRYRTHGSSPPVARRARFLSDHWELVLEKGTDVQMQKARGE